MLCMGEDAKQPQVRRLFVPDASDLAPLCLEWELQHRQVTHTCGKGFPPCCFHCVSAVPQSLLHGDSAAASCSAHLWEFSPEP